MEQMYIRCTCSHLLLLPISSFLPLNWAMKQQRGNGHVAESVIFVAILLRVKDSAAGVTDASMGNVLSTECK